MGLPIYELGLSVLPRTSEYQHYSNVDDIFELSVAPQLCDHAACRVPFLQRSESMAVESWMRLVHPHKVRLPRFRVSRKLNFCPLDTWVLSRSLLAMSDFLERSRPRHVRIIISLHPCSKVKSKLIIDGTIPSIDGWSYCSQCCRQWCRKWFWASGAFFEKKLVRVSIERT